ncbi:MAG: LysM peptidoglycan-binding domain-containing protein [Roseburia sp.]|nr:LysM peptidoglycan-binding domain-containing protein [Roseburia sp.]
MHKSFHSGRTAAAVFLTGLISSALLTGCQGDAAKPAGYSALKPQTVEDGKGCPAQRLAEYLNEKAPQAPYAYAQILIDPTALQEEEPQKLLGVLGNSIGGEEDYYAVNMEGTADIAWQTFETAADFQAYLEARQQEESIVFSEDTAYTIELSYYQYQLEEGVHALDIDRFLRERYDGEETPLYAITLEGGYTYGYDSYCFSQSGVREMVVKDGVFYALECKGMADESNAEDIRKLLMRYCIQRQGADDYSGWVMEEENLYWVDHEERTTRLEDPARTFTEVRAKDTNRMQHSYMEYFSMFTEAEYALALSEDGPEVRIHFHFTQEIPETGYEVYLWNGFCSDEPYEMTVTDVTTGELLQKRNVQMSIELPDMITFTDLDSDGYLDMRIGMPNHSSGERAVMDSYAKQTYWIWLPEEKNFASMRESEVSERRSRNQESAFMEYVVQPGDTLWDIARRFYGSGRLYTRIEQDNEETLAQYRYLMPGTILKIDSSGQ